MANVVREIMAQNPVTLPSDTTVVEAARRMRQDDVGDIIVSAPPGTRTPSPPFSITFSLLLPRHAENLRRVEATRDQR
jgi:CBS domain-containing protein